jgi:hypothetical protein
LDFWRFNRVYHKDYVKNGSAGGLGDRRCALDDGPGVGLVEQLLCEAVYLFNLIP